MLFKKSWGELGAKFCCLLKFAHSVTRIAHCETRGGGGDVGRFDKTNLFYLQSLKLVKLDSNWVKKRDFVLIKGRVQIFKIHTF